MKPQSHITLCFLLYLSTFQLCTGAFVPRCHHGSSSLSSSFLLLRGQQQEKITVRHNSITSKPPIASVSSIPLHRGLKETGIVTSKAKMSLKSSSHDQSSNVTNPTRRSLFQKATSVLLASSLGGALMGSLPANAKEKAPVTKEAITASFQAVKDELEAPDGGIKRLEVLIANEDFSGIMEFTKGYDLEFRKAKMGKARKLLTSKEDKDRAVALCNAVTFDLIGMNKGSREGQQDINKVKKYYEELKADVKSFLELEEGIDYSMIL